jgi:Putative DNA-binding domain
MPGVPLGSTPIFRPSGSRRFGPRDVRETPTSARQEKGRDLEVFRAVIWSLKTMSLDPLESLRRQIARRNPSGILDIMFQRNPFGLRDGFFKQDELWDYKGDIPAISKGNEIQWANIAADVLAFHNRNGGVLVFGIRNRDFRFVGATHRFDTKLFNDKIRRYVGDRFWVSFSRGFIQYDQPPEESRLPPNRFLRHERCYAV